MYFFSERTSLCTPYFSIYSKKTCREFADFNVAVHNVIASGHTRHHNKRLSFILLSVYGKSYRQQDCKHYTDRRKREVITLIRRAAILQLIPLDCIEDAFAPGFWNSRRRRNTTWHRLQTIHTIAVDRRQTSVESFWNRRTPYNKQHRGMAW